MINVNSVKKSWPVSGQENWISEDNSFEQKMRGL